MIYCHTGFGKGKTTAAIGLALRALANNEKVLFVQFLKDGNDGAIKELKKYENFTHIAQGTKGIKLEDCTKFYEKTLDYTCSDTEEYDLVIYDEINVAMDYNLLDTPRVIKDLPYNVYDICITGRVNNHSLRHKLYEISDIATNFYCETHKFNKVCSNCGIDYSNKFVYCPACGKKLPKSKEFRVGREC